MRRERRISIRIDAALAEKVEKILGELGLTPEQAVSLLFRQIVLRNGLPFELRVSGKRAPRGCRDILQEADAVEGAEGPDEGNDWFNDFVR